MESRVDGMAYNAPAAMQSGDGTSRANYSGGQVSKALANLKRRDKKPEDISAAICGIGSSDAKIAQKCRAALGKLDQSSFTEGNLMAVIGMISGKGDAVDNFCVSLLQTMVFQAVPVFISRPNKLAFKIHLRKEGIAKLDPGYLKAILAMPEGAQSEILLYRPAEGNSFPYDARKKGKHLEIGERTGATAPAFTWGCFDALLGAYCHLLQSQSSSEGFVNGGSGDNPLIGRLGRILRDITRLDKASPPTPEQAAALSSRLSAAFGMLEKNPRIYGAGTIFETMHNFLDKPDLGIVTKEHYLSMISLIGKYDNDSLIQIYAAMNPGLLSHDDIEIFKKGLTDRDSADVYAKIFRHVDRFYVKHFRKEDLDVFIDNIDQNKPEYCSGETCGCKARAIADMANVLPEMFDERHVKVAVNTFQTSSTYKDGAAMMLGFLAVKEPEKFGEMCINGLASRLDDPVFFDAGIITLYIALNQTEKFGEKIRDAYVRGLGNANSRAGCMWALEKLLSEQPGLADGPTREIMGKYPLSNRKRLDAQTQYIHYEEYFKLRVFSNPMKIIDELNDAVMQEKETKKQAK